MSDDLIARPRSYDVAIRDIIGYVREDKTIIQPWRNKAVARLEEAQAFVRMGKTSVNNLPEPPATMTAPTVNTCTCPVGARDKLCPVHGD